MIIYKQNLPPMLQQIILLCAQTTMTKFNVLLIVITVNFVSEERLINIGSIYFSQRLFRSQALSLSCLHLRKLQQLFQNLVAYISVGLV